ncbi:hypothetical protein B0H16DRAFT_1744774 [Mycena metata]|uniref:Uncharacterized protein n=1 Tax=Mycena metata TaxID=1033252 RepID=A0AAD7H430_9AGAR|nr:hypothetical protein B0H16DRAFT_1744774 [Mycena metata]
MSPHLFGTTWNNSFGCTPSSRLRLQGGEVTAFPPPLTGLIDAKRTRSTYGPASPSPFFFQCQLQTDGTTRADAATRELWKSWEGGRGDEFGIGDTDSVAEELERTPEPAPVASESPHNGGGGNYTHTRAGLDPFGLHDGTALFGADVEALVLVEMRAVSCEWGEHRRWRGHGREGRRAQRTSSRGSLPPRGALANLLPPPPGAHTTRKVHPRTVGELFQRALQHLQPFAPSLPVPALSLDAFLSVTEFPF